VVVETASIVCLFVLFFFLFILIRSQGTFRLFIAKIKLIGEGNDDFERGIHSSPLSLLDSIWPRNKTRYLPMN